MISGTLKNKVKPFSFASKTDAESAELGPRKVFPIAKLGVVDLASGATCPRQPLYPVEEKGLEQQF
jgi:hypothetical protein